MNRQDVVSALLESIGLSPSTRGPYPSAQPVHGSWAGPLDIVPRVTAPMGRRPVSADQVAAIERAQGNVVAHQRYPDTAVGAPVAGGWAPGYPAPMPWDAAYTPVAAVVEPRPIPPASVAGPPPLSPTRTPGRHVPGPPPLHLKGSVIHQDPRPWEGNVAGPRVTNQQTRRVPVIDPPLAQPWGMAGPTPVKAGTPVSPPMGILAGLLRGVRRDPPPTRPPERDMPVGKTSVRRIF